MATTDRPQTLQQAVIYFSDPDNCLADMIKFRWLNGPVECPTCGSTKVSFIKTRRVWECSERHPQRQFSVKVGTIMEDSPIPLDKWLLTMWLIANAKNGISSYEIARAIGVTQKSAWFMLHRIRLAMQNEDGGKLSGRIEVDETYIGAKARNMTGEKRRRVLGGDKGGLKGKTAVQGMLERTNDIRHSQVRLKVVKGARREHLMPNIIDNIEPLSVVYTDALKSYELMPDDFFHQMIDHAEKYVDGQIHTNGLENFWSLLKRTLNGTYVSVEPFHLFRYLDEQAFRFNNRRLSDSARYAITVAAAIGKRLTFKQLTAADATC